MCDMLVGREGHIFADVVPDTIRHITVKDIMDPLLKVLQNSRDFRMNNFSL